MLRRSDWFTGTFWKTLISMVGGGYRPKTFYKDTITSPQATIIDLKIMFGCINTDRESHLSWTSGYLICRTLIFQWNFNGLLPFGI